MRNQLSTVGILHYVYGALLCVLGTVLLALIYAGSIMQAEDFPEFTGATAPAWLGASLQLLGTVLFVLVEAHGILNLVSAGMIRKHKGRTFSQVVAALNCLNIPMGMALGIYTFVVLGDREVQEIYEARSWGPGGTVVH